MNRCGEVNYQGKKLTYLGGERHTRGVGFVLSKDASAWLEGYYTKSDRIILIKHKGRPINVNLIHVYAPISDAEEDVIDKYLSEPK